MKIQEYFSKHIYQKRIVLIISLPVVFLCFLIARLLDAIDNCLENISDAIFCFKRAWKNEKW